jgi:hypothetical protein
VDHLAQPGLVIDDQNSLHEQQLSIPPGNTFA